MSFAVGFAEVNLMINRGCVVISAMACETIECSTLRDGRARPIAHSAG